MNRNPSNFDNQEITLHYKIFISDIKTSIWFKSSFLLFLMILCLVLATKRNDNLYDYKFYANSRLPYINQIFSSKQEFSLKPKPKSAFFGLVAPIISADPLKFFNKFKDLNELIINSDTLKPDTTKKKQVDTLKTADTIKITPAINNNLADTTKLDSAFLSAILKEDSTKKKIDRQRDSLNAISDSISRALLDSIMNVDSLRLIDSNALKNERKLILVDSSARITHFTAKNQTTPVAPFMKETYHPLFGPKNQTYTYEVKLDTISNIVTISEKINGINIRIPTFMKLDDYINLTRSYYTRKGWEALAHKYDFKLKQDVEIGSLLTSITNIDIPIPENPLMSIFGDRSRINLRITGAVDIKGAFRNQKSEGTTLNNIGNSRNEPDFKQNVSIQVDGTVGDKLTIGANWDTQRVFDFENQLKIAYKGYEDEIIQSIEAGNVGITSASSLVGSSQALFGLKAQWLLGPLRLTTVATQKKSEKKEVSVSGGSQKQQFEKKAYEYATNHFFVDSSYRQTWADYYSNSIPRITDETKIVEIEVWVTRLGIIERTDERSVIADINLPPLSPRQTKYDESYQNLTPVPGQVEAGRFYKLLPDQYRWYEATGHIAMLGSVADDQAIAVAYKTFDGKVYGYFSNAIDSTQKVIVLKLVKPRGLIPAFKKAWKQQIRCIYPMNARDINPKSLEDVKITYADPKTGQDMDNIKGVNFLEIFGLDKTDEALIGGPDNKFDYRADITINAQSGEIIFPMLEPFREAFLNFRKDGQPIDEADKYVFSDVYDTTIVYAQQNTEKNKFFIRGKVTGSTSDRYSLGMSVVPGSVKVFHDGQELTPGVDYILDEISGQVVIRKSEALIPGANVQIKYEENDLISFASKTLLGATGEMDIGTSTKLGFTWVNLVQQTLSEKVRLGEEPINNHIFGIAATSSFDMPFLTSALNYLPFFSSKDASSLSLHAEAAYISPDPNTKKSTISSDNGEGVAYIDDFEGARQSIPLGISWALWKLPSSPAVYPNLVADDSVVNGYKAKSVWYNVYPSNVLVQDIWPQRNPATEDKYHTYLTYKYFPDQRGSYNYYPTLPDKRKNWGGLMRNLGANATKLKQSNYTFVEIWMKIEGTDLSSAKLLLDLGKINEKVITSKLIPTTNGVHQEDGLLTKIMNTKVDEGEDVGIDGLNDAQERALFPNLGEDPSADDFSFVNNGSEAANDYSRMNGLEGNSALTEIGNFPDTEDLNRNGIIDQTNSYFEYEIALDVSEAIRKKQIVGGGSKGWYQFRIPLTEFTRTVGTPDLDQVEYVRLWVTGTSEDLVLRIAQFDVVGNQWQEMKRKDTTGNLAADTTLKISVVSIEETPGYTSPPGVQRARDMLRPDQEVFANEQALALEIKGLVEGDYREAVKYLTSMPLDVFNYRSMRMFVHGDPSFKYTDSTNYDAQFYFRFGLDTANYYEYVMPLQGGDLDAGWYPNDIAIDFKTLATLKPMQDTGYGGKKMYASLDVPGKPGAKYRIYGSPTLMKVAFILVGVRNPQNRGPSMPLFGTVWVNELRLTSVDDTKGWAIRADASLKLSNLANISFNYSQTNPYFHSVDGRFGSRNDDKSWGITGNIALHNLLPKEVVGQNFSVSFSHTESVNDPLYIPGTDISIKETADKLAANPETLTQADSLRTVSQTIRINETISIPTIQLRIPVRYWLLEETINKLGFSFNYTSSSERTPLVEKMTSWNWSFTSNYSLSLSGLISFSPFYKLFDGYGLLDQYKNIKYTLLPEISMNLGANRSRREEKQRTEKTDRLPTRSFSATRSMGVKFKFVDGGLINPGMDYSVNVSSNLSHLETADTVISEGLKIPRQRTNSQIFSQIFFKQALIDFGIDNSYNQTVNFTTSLALPKSLKMDEFLTVNIGDYKSDYRWSHNLSQAEFGKSSSVSTNFAPSMTFKLKNLADKIFGSESQPAQGDASGRSRITEETTPKSADTVTKRPGFGINLKGILRSVIKIPLLDFESISINFSQQNSIQNGGLPGTSGFNNFWGRVPFLQGPDDEFGPSREYQLGLVSSPTGRIKLISRSAFPFFDFERTPGPRVKTPFGSSIQFTDNFSTTNSLSFGTSRNLFENISMTFNWKVSWATNKNSSFKTDSLGNEIQSIATSTSNIDRSFISLPDFFLFNLFGGGGIKKVAELYAKDAPVESADGTTQGTQNQNEKLASAFQSGFEFFPILSKLFGELAPRANWNIRWSGLEKIPFIGSFANSMTISHAYTGNQTKRYRVIADGSTVTDGQRIQYNFSPLIGVDISFKEMLGGSFNSGVRFSSGSAFDLASGTTNITESSTKEISATAGFAKQGFNIPLFGLYLKNDIDISVTFSYSGSDRKMYRIDGLNLSTDGASDDSSTRTSFEPRFRYVISSKVTGSVYYRYAKTTGARIPGNTTNEGGLDVHISIN